MIQKRSIELCCIAAATHAEEIGGITTADSCSNLCVAFQSLTAQDQSLVIAWVRHDLTLHGNQLVIYEVPVGILLTSQIVHQNEFSKCVYYSKCDA